ncbi:Flp pilus assembly complex ATPase component TadA [Natronolimnobius sp. AArcel1]|uniref:ATPase, T2SS/T4P/T4SS family n=1 Tax=Natronolimnobius sp. AArcel1 TaxID=1679093 RepID=UPI0013EA7163|nr:ATPase, T2SS/T4P/T4SS family [Natronolimnobius sp. AArcel1]NGM67539.1 Flp pilus assembly complex ATPase component TadA [Natronolimnobius sp. AArcel1]
MAIDEGKQSGAGGTSAGDASDAMSEGNRAATSGSSRVRVGDYSWEDFMTEYGYGEEISALYPDDPTPDEDDQLGLETGEASVSTVPRGEDWDRVSFDPSVYLGYHPDDIRDHVLPTAGTNNDILERSFLKYVDPETTPVVKDVWTWEHYKWEYYYEEDGSRPRDSDGKIVRHDKEEALGFDPETLEERLTVGADRAMELDDVVEERTVNVQDDIEEDDFFSTADGATTLSNRYDLEKSVPMDKKTHYQEVERYWVNKPYAYVVIFHSEKENEKKYYMIEPYINEIEGDLQEFLSGKLRTAIKYSDDGIKEKANEDGRRNVIEDETRRLLKRYDLFEKTAGSKTAGIIETVQSLLNDDDEDDEDGPDELEGIEVRPEPAILADDPDTLNEYQVEKLLYLLKRNFIGYERIDGIKHDINVEDVSCDGYNSPVFVYHSDYEQIISNIYHGEDELDDFVVKLAQRSGKGISKRLPQVDATLPDGSRAQLTLGKEVSDHGTNYTIRQFKDVPFTPIDLINWNTFSLDEMAFLWLCIENHKSLIFAGGTASGKTTSLNAVSLFIPSSAKIVSIEDTREVELPQRNWIASITRPSFSDDEQGDVDEFDLLEAALRQRPDYIVMGEIRGEEGRTLFQVMSTGHTTYTTFHADSVDEVLKRFTTDPINVSKTMFTALDLVSIQTQTRVQGNKVRRNKSLTEINHYEAENDEINVQDVYQWQAETDEYLKMGDSNTLEEIQFDRGWNNEKLQQELFKRQVILAYLIKNELNTYAEVAATAQAFINDPETILTLIANGQLEDSLDDLREMESVLIDVDQDKEELVPRPDPTTETYNTSTDILERAEESLFEEYRGKVPSGLASALGDIEDAETIDVEADDTSDDEEFGFSDSFSTGNDSWSDASGFTVGSDGSSDQPSWITDDTDFEVGFDESGTTDTATAGADTGSSTTASASTASGSNGGFGPTDESSGADSDPFSSAGSSTDIGGVGGGSSTGQFDMNPIETADAEPSTEDAVNEQLGARGSSVAPDADDDLGGLFENMGEALAELDEAETATTNAPAPGHEGTDGDDDSPVFAQESSGSIFDPDSSAGEGSGDFTAHLSDVETESEESPSASDAWETNAGSQTTSTSEAETASTPAPDHAPASETEPEPDSEVESTLESEPAPDTESSSDTSATDDGANSNEVSEQNVPTIEIDESMTSESDGEEATAPDDTGAESAGKDEPAAESAPDSDPPTIELDDPTLESQAGDAESAATEDESPDETGDAVTDGNNEAIPAENGESPTDTSSIFGDESESVFTETDEEETTESGSLFDEREETDDGSIFTDNEDEAGDADEINTEDENAADADNSTDADSEPNENSEGDQQDSSDESAERDT